MWSLAGISMTMPVQPQSLMTFTSEGMQRETCEAAARWSTVPYVVDGVLAYVEDVDWSIRMRRAGFGVVFVPTARA